MNRALLISLVSTFAIAGCDSTSPSPSPFEPKDGDMAFPKNTVQGTGSIQELQRRQNAWLTNGSRNYRVEEQVFCFCGFNEPNPAVVEIRAGLITRAWNRRTGDEFSPQTREKRSVEELFEYALNRAAAGEQIRVSYDASFGYPAILTVGTPENDGGVTYVLANLRRF
jgi:hypothetical protein